MTIGAGVYSPQSKFSFPRSYVRGISLEVVANGITMVGDTITFINPSLPSQHFTVVIDPRVFPWSSNGYTLDYVISESYYQNDPDPTEFPMSFALSYFMPAARAPYLNFQPFQLNFAQKHYFDLPLAPPGYWLPEWGTAP
jgi:hypothetical protein